MEPRAKEVDAGTSSALSAQFFVGAFPEPRSYTLVAKKASTVRGTFKPLLGREPQIISPDVFVGMNADHPALKLQLILHLHMTNTSELNSALTGAHAQANDPVPKVRYCVVQSIRVHRTHNNPPKSWFGVYEPPLITHLLDHFKAQFGGVAEGVSRQYGDQGIYFQLGYE